MSVRSLKDHGRLCKCTQRSGVCRHPCGRSLGSRFIMLARGTGLVSSLCEGAWHLDLQCIGTRDSRDFAPSNSGQSQPKDLLKYFTGPTLYEGPRGLQASPNLSTGFVLQDLFYLYEGPEKPPSFSKPCYLNEPKRLPSLSEPQQHDPQLELLRGTLPPSTPGALSREIHRSEASLEIADVRHIFKTLEPAP